MEKHIPYPSTPSFSNFKREYLRALNYTRPETNSEAVTEDDKKLISRPPRVGQFVGTIKLHGTNATIVYTNGDRKNPRFQARTWVITNKQDNQGTRALLAKAPLHELVDEILRIHKSETFEEMYIAGEIAGKGIQKGVAISALDRFFAIFNIRIDGNWVDIRDYKSVALPSYRIFNIAQYPIFTITIDFRNDTTEIVKEMENRTMDVYNECPFGAAFLNTEGRKVSGVGEGIVWTLVKSKDDERPLHHDVLWNFKTKGERFSTANPSKPKNLNREGMSKEQQEAILFADYALTERRLEQGLEHLLLEQSRKGIPESEQNAFDPKLTGAFLKWVIDDAVREEGDKMKEMNREVRKEFSTRARKWFVEKSGEAANALKL
jgi:hypothetical protein